MRCTPRVFFVIPHSHSGTSFRVACGRGEQGELQISPMWFQTMGSGLRSVFEHFNLCGLLNLHINCEGLVLQGCCIGCGGGQEQPRPTLAGHCRIGGPAGCVATGRLAVCASGSAHHRPPVHYHGSPSYYLSTLAGSPPTGSPSLGMYPVHICTSDSNPMPSTCDVAPHSPRTCFSISWRMPGCPTPPSPVLPREMHPPCVCHVAGHSANAFPGRSSCSPSQQCGRAGGGGGGGG